MTNGDRIRRMSNEELAEFIRNGNVCSYMSKPECLYRTCEEGIKAYLESEVEKGEMKNENYDKSTNAR